MPLPAIKGATGELHLCVPVPVPAKFCPTLGTLVAQSMSHSVPSIKANERLESLRKKICGLGSPSIVLRESRGFFLVCDVTAVCRMFSASLSRCPRLAAVVVDSPVISLLSFRLSPSWFSSAASLTDCDSASNYGYPPPPPSQPESPPPVVASVPSS